MFNILITCYLLAACTTSGTQAPSNERRQPPSTKVDTHIVSPGETLYAIAWRYGLDYQQLAKANGIGSNFLIYSGQTLQIGNIGKATRQVSVSKNTSSTIKKANVSAAPKTTSTASKPRPPVTISTQTSSKARSSSRSEKKSSPKPAKKTPASTKQKLQWRWPSSGRVLTNFSGGQSSNKGIDISGKKGDSVIAAASGRIVYAGSGLRGYGKLVIIKHNDTYLSAYAHNDRLHVREGQVVNIGQRIADIGSSGSRTDSAKLHFEIRRNGKPINPLTLLPKRKI